MKRRKFLKSILATAAVAVVPFKIGSGDDVVKKWASNPRSIKVYKGEMCRPTTFIDEMPEPDFIRCAAPRLKKYSGIIKI